MGMVGKHPPFRDRIKMNFIERQGGGRRKLLWKGMVQQDPSATFSSRRDPIQPLAGGEFGLFGAQKFKIFLRFLHRR